MPKDGLSDDMIRAIYTDDSGKVWFGFNGNRNSGLTSYAGEDFTTYSLKDGLCNQSILAISEDKEGNLWLGSGRRGICVFDGSTFSDFTSKDGASFDVIHFILNDQKDNTWFGGKNGLWKYDGSNVTDMTLPQ
jgi:ligand-binding sensor domain-containing protein